MDGCYDTIRRLVQEGERLELRDPKSYRKLARWIEDACLALKPFPLECDQFRLYCIESFAFPQQKLTQCLEMLRAVLCKEPKSN